MKTDLPWKETLDISVDVNQIENPEDDIKRELALLAWTLRLME